MTNPYRSQPPYGQQPYGPRPGLPPGHFPGPAPYGPPAQPYDPPVQWHFEPGATGIVVNVSRPPIHYANFWLAPVILINGEPIPEINWWGDVARWGDNHLPLAPGWYDLTVATTSNGLFGSRCTVPVFAGHETRVFYRAPAHFFRRGAMGPEPQPTRGMVGASVSLTICAIFFVLMIVWIFLG